MSGKGIDVIGAGAESSTNVGEAITDLNTQQSPSILLRAVVVDVLYDRSEKVYMAIYIPRGEENISKNRERTPLKEIFELAKDTEDWVKPEYLAAV